MGTDFPNLSYHTGRNEFLDTARLGVESIHETFHETDAVLDAGIDLPSDIVRGGRQRFLAQHGLTCFGRANGPFRMHRVWQRYVNGVDIRIFKQCFVAADDPANSERTRDVFSLLEIAACENLDPAEGRSARSER
jgi:hypothetical protein